MSELKLGTMNLLRDRRVVKYISSLDGLSPSQYVPMACLCIKENMLINDAHCETVKPFSKNLAELAANQGPKNIRLIVMYITKVFYFNGDTMKFLVNEMLECRDVETVEQYYNVLDQNFMKHPPCAQYMHTEYEQLLLSTYRKCFNEMTLWDYLVDCLNQITSGIILYGDSEVHDLAFKRCFTFCVTILQIDFEVSKKKNLRSLVAKCLNYNCERRTRMSEINKLLDMLFNTGYDFQMPVINLAILISQMTS